MKIMTNMTRIYKISSASFLLIAVTAFSLYLHTVLFQSGIPALPRLCLIAVFTAAWYASLLSSRKFIDNKKYSVYKLTVFYIYFALYCFFLCDLVLFDQYFGRQAENITLFEHIKSSVNLIPFKTIIGFFIDLFKGVIGLKSFLVNILGNIAAFAPFGFFLPFLFKRQRKTPVFIITTFLIITAVELLQMLTMTGACDIDDLILNLCGAYFLYFIYKSRSKYAK